MSRAIEVRIRKRRGGFWSLPAKGWAEKLEGVGSALYVLTDGIRVVYVGESDDVRSRIRTHVSEKPFATAHVYSCDEIQRKRLERLFIRLLRPPLNSTHTGRPRKRADVDPFRWVPGSGRIDEIQELRMEIRAMSARLEAVLSMAKAATGRREALSKKEACRRLGIGEDGLQKLMMHGLIRTIPWGRSCRVPMSEVERILRDGFPDLEMMPARPVKAIRPRKLPPAYGVGARIKGLRIDG